MPNAFDELHAPFDRLTPEEVECCAARSTSSISAPTKRSSPRARRPKVSTSSSRAASKSAPGELVGLLGRKDFFDSRALVQGAGVSASSPARKPCARCCRARTCSTSSTAIRVSAPSSTSTSRASSRPSRERRRISRIGAMMRARVSDLNLLPAAVIDSVDTIASAGRIMRDIDCNALLVRDGDRTGIVTGMNLSKAVVLKGMTIDEPVKGDRAIRHGHRRAGRFRLAGAAADDQAQQAPTRGERGREFRRHSRRHQAAQFLRRQFAAGRRPHRSRLSLQELGAPPRRSPTRCGRCAVRASSSKWSRKSSPTSTAACSPNCSTCCARRKCATRLPDRDGQRGARRADHPHRSGQWPDPLRTRGRGGAEKFREAFSGALADFGFPPCPGHVMVRNPFWSRTLDEYVADFSRGHAARRKLGDERRDLLRRGGGGRRRRAARRGEEGLFAATRATARVSRVSPGPSKRSDADRPVQHAEAGRRRRRARSEKGRHFSHRPWRALARDRAGAEETNTFGGWRSSPNWPAQAAISHATSRRRCITDDHAARRPDRRGGQRARCCAGALTSMDRDLLRDSFQVVKQLRDLMRHHFNLNMF